MMIYNVQSGSLKGWDRCFTCSSLHRIFLCVVIFKQACTGTALVLYMLTEKYCFRVLLVIYFA
jgi:hypothetical protein